jgi:hypothetical protein
VAKNISEHCFLKRYNKSLGSTQAVPVKIGFQAMSKKPLIPLLIFALLVSCVSGHRKPFGKIHQPARDISTLERRLRTAVDMSENLSMQTIGKVIYDDFQAPIWRIVYQPQTDTPPILVNAGIHGNEPAGVEFAIRLVEDLSHHPERYPRYPVYIIPLVNPWGWCHDIRFNRDGIDINRDLVSLKSQEGAIIRNYIQEKSFLLMLDLHEDPSARGFYLYQYAAGDKTVGQSITRKISRMGYPLEQDVHMAILKTKNGIIDAPMWGLWYMNLTRQLSLANYYRLHNSTAVFTIETPVVMDFDERLFLHKTAVEGLIRHFVKRYNSLHKPPA